MKELSEFSLDVVGEIVKFLGDFFVWSDGVNELHLLQVINDGREESFFDESHGDLSFSFLRFLKHLFAVLVISDNTLKHSNCLWKWAVVIVLSECILLQELVLDQFGDFKSSFLIFTKRVFSDKLHDFNKIILLLQDSLDSILESHEVWISGVVVFREGSVVVCERNIPVD